MMASRPGPVPTLRVLELFCGIGGCSAALAGHAEVVAAVDINQHAIEVYRTNFHPRALAASIESIPRDVWQAWAAELWWMSPPCQPFTRRGKQLDLADRRLAFWTVLLDRLTEAQPRYLVVENVPPFRESRACEQLTHRLEHLGYCWKFWDVCPTELGVPNRRRRVYLMAARADLPCRIAQPPPPRLLRDFLDADPSPELTLSVETARAYADAMHVVDPANDDAVAACFTAAYGRSIVRSGSYLRIPLGVRRFSSAEIARLLGWPTGFRFPARCSRRQQWKLLGNSLSVPAVRWVLTQIPELGGIGSRTPEVAS